MVKPKKKPKLNDKQRAFARHYLVDKNATAAALRAGYSQKTAGSQGQRLLKNVEIRKLIEAADQKLSDRIEADRFNIYSKIAKIANVDIDDAEYKPRDQFAALNLMSKITGLVDDKVRHEHGGQIVLNVVSPIPGAPGSRIGEDPDAG